LEEKGELSAGVEEGVDAGCGSGLAKGPVIKVFPCSAEVVDAVIGLAKLKGEGLGASFVLEEGPKLKDGLEAPVVTGPKEVVEVDDGVEDVGPGPKENDGLDSTVLFASDAPEVDVGACPNVKDALGAVGAVVADDDVEVWVEFWNGDVVEGCDVTPKGVVAGVVTGFAKRLGIDPAGVFDGGLAKGEGAPGAGVFVSRGTGVAATGFVSWVGLFVAAARGVHTGAADFAFSFSLSSFFSCAFSFSSLSRIFFSEFASMSCFSHFENDLEERSFGLSPGLFMSNWTEATRRPMLLGARSKGFRMLDEEPTDARPFTGLGGGPLQSKRFPADEECSSSTVASALTGVLLGLASCHANWNASLAVLYSSSFSHFSTTTSTLVQASL
jgi:hypothetical protein